MKHDDIGDKWMTSRLENNTNENEGTSGKLSPMQFCTLLDDKQDRK
jgi:hypothetical protein